MSSSSTILSFPRYKVEHGASQTNTEPSLYDAATENFPDDPWYALEHAKIENGIDSMCSELLDLVHDHNPGDAEVANLEQALQKAKIIPQGEDFNVVFLGEQGIGKSSTINAVFDRKLVNVSASSSACTAFPTIITYKNGAPDNTTSSTVGIAFLSEQEIQECCEEQARLYADAFRRNPEDASVKLEVHDSDEDPHSSDEDDENSARSSSAGGARGQQQQEVPASVLRAGKIAKAFFDILFDTENETNREQLDYFLDSADLEGDDFVLLCHEQAELRLQGLQVVDSMVSYRAVPDSELPEIQGWLAGIWPLVKCVTIATGHVLLRNNVCILDLPGKGPIRNTECTWLTKVGYGDDNHIRTALTDEFREQTHFEIVMAPTARVVSSLVQERYLNRSIRRLGARNTLLVTAKSDVSLK